MASVLFSESAKADLLEAWLFIAEESVVSADDLVDAIHQVVKILSSAQV